MQNPISGIDLLGYFRSPKPNLLVYSDIKKYRNIHQLLGKRGACIILYRTSDRTGHWCCIYRNKEGLNFFDSYGFVPDDQLGFIPNHLQKALGQDFMYLTKMMLDSKLRVQYNEYQLQDYDDHRIATCGRWCVVRLEYPSVSVERFKDIFRGHRLSPDQIVYGLTSSQSAS
jgi:hypothetical protein